MKVSLGTFYILRQSSRIKVNVANCIADAQRVHVLRLSIAMRILSFITR